MTRASVGERNLMNTIDFRVVDIQVFCFVKKKNDNNDTLCTLAIELSATNEEPERGRVDPESTCHTSALG